MLTVQPADGVSSGDEGASNSENSAYLRDTSDAAYAQLLLYAGGNALALAATAALGVAAWQVWHLMSPFASAILWAVLLSVALRDTKDALVRRIRRALASDRRALFIDAAAAMKWK